MVTGSKQLPATLADYLNRYQLATAENLSNRGLTGCGSVEEARQLLLGFEQCGKLKSSQLMPGDETSTFYYAVGKHATLASGASFAPSERSLEERLALWSAATFCAPANPPRELLTRDEFAGRFKQLCRPGESLRYYLEPTPDGARLAYIKVDLGGASQWDRVVDSCCRFIEKRQRTGANMEINGASEPGLFDYLIQQERFQISLLVATAEKAAAVNTRLYLDQAKSGVRPPIVPYVVPGLLELLFRMPGKRSSVGRRRTNRRKTQNSGQGRLPTS